MTDEDILFKVKNCSVRKFKEKDIPYFTSYHNDLEWMRFQGFKGLSEAEYKKILLGKSDLKKGIQLAVVDLSDRLVGDLYVCELPDIIEIGFTVSPLCSRREYAREAVSGLINYLRKTSEKSITAEIESENASSAGLLTKLGFLQISEKEGIKRFFI